MTIVQLADKIGVDIGLISKWENNKRKPKLENLLKLSEVLGIDLLNIASEGNLSPDKFEEHEGRIKKLEAENESLKQDIQILKKLILKMTPESKEIQA